MTRFEYINNNLLTPEGIKKQIRLGIIPTSVFRYFEIYSRYDYYRKKEGHKKYMAIGFTSEDYGVHDNTILNAIKNMEAEI